MYIIMQEKENNYIQKDDRKICKDKYTNLFTKKIINIDMIHLFCYMILA